MHAVFTEKLNSYQLGETYMNRRLVNKMSSVKIKHSLILLKELCH